MARGLELLYAIGGGNKHWLRYELLITMCFYDL